MDGQGRAAVPRGTLRRLPRGDLLVLPGALVVALACALGVAALERPPAPTAPIAAVSATPQPPRPVVPSLLAPSASTSDAFDAWTRGGDESAVRFLASDDARSGSYALRVTRPATAAGGESGRLDQTVPVAEDAPLHVSLAVRATGAADGAVLLRVTAGGVTTVALPGGTYGWRTVTLTATVPAKVRAATISLVSAGPTGSTEIDDVVVQPTGSSGSQLQNDGFERNSADLAITGDSLLLPAGSATLDLATRRAPSGRLSWTTTDLAGRATASGETDIRNGRATLALRAVPQGYAVLEVRARIAQKSIVRRTRILLLPPFPAGSRSAFGVGVHLAGRDPATVRATLHDLAAIGITQARTDVSWPEIERTKGRYTFPAGLDATIGAMRAAGIRPLLIPDYANPLYDDGRTPSSAAGIAAYARFAAAVATQYRDADIDVYNEFDFRQNDGRCGRTPDCYLRLLKPTAAAVRAARTGAAISAPSITGTGVNFDWLRPFLAGGGAASLDALALHPYVQPGPPDSLVPALDRLRAEVRAAAGRDVPIWFTEMGWSTVPGWVDERTQAADLTRTMAIALGHGVQRVYWYDAVDDSRLPLDLESNFGLFEQPDSFAPRALVPKPAAAAEAAVSRHLAGCAFAGVDGGLPTGVTSYRFRCADEDRRVVWADGDAAVRIAGRGSAATGTGEPLPATAGTPLDLAAGPVLLRGDARPVSAG